LFQVPASGGTASPLTIPDASHGERFHMWPQALPTGHFLYWVRNDQPGKTGIFASSFAKPGERVRLLTADTNALYAPGGDGRDYLLWLRGGTLLAQEFDASGLKLVGEPHPLADPVSQLGFTGPQMNVAVSASGQLLYSSANTSGQFTWLDRSGKRLRVVGEPGEYTQFRLSPDGNRIATARSRRGGQDLWLFDVERGTSSRFTDASTNAPGYPAWSPSSRTIVFSNGLPHRNLVFKEAVGAGADRATIELPDYWFPWDWSRDGRFILYWRYEVYVDTFPERRHKTPISTGGGQYPSWGAGGRELYYVSPDFKLMAVSLKLGKDYAEPSVPRELFPLPGVDTGFSPYEVAPDGQRFLVRATPQQQAAEPLTVIVNWPALMKKEAAAQ
jgi:dipeptidyl aminopeptidase/acylaminoacyl peptidase